MTLPFFVFFVPHGENGVLRHDTATSRLRVLGWSCRQRLFRADDATAVPHDRLIGQRQGKLGVLLHNNGRHLANGDKVANQAH